MATLKRIILFHKTRKFRNCFYRYSLFRESGHLSISIEEINNGKTSFKSIIRDPEYSEKACLAFITILANTLTFPEQLHELYEENDLNTLPLE